jgi:hypothetical protein
MHRALLLMFVALSGGCPPPPVEPHQAAAMLRDNPSHMGAVSREEIESEVTDPNGHVGTAATPEPKSDNIQVTVIGTVQKKLCFSIDSSLEGSANAKEAHATFGWRMRNAAWSVQARPRTVYSVKTPWPDPAQDVMVKVNTEDEALTSGVAHAVVCLPSPVFEKDSVLLAFTMAWQPNDRKLALWKLAQ